MNCTIRWNELDLAGWERNFARLRRSTILQSYDYARATAPLYGQRPRWGLIMIDGAEAGMVQTMEAGIFGIHAMTLDRGPLWFDGFGGVAHIKAFFETLNRDFPRRFGRKRRIIPELPDSQVASGIVSQSGFTYRGPKYTTVWIDLRPALEVLRAGLKSNWRNHLNKAERSDLLIDWSNPLDHLQSTIAGYQADRTMKGYPGPDPKIVTALGRTFGARDQLLVGRAVLGEHNIAAAFILCHGGSATYQVGWSNEDGRKHGGHYRLLWSAIEKLKARGTTDFDLGGIHDNNASGVTSFKDGMGGERVTLAGLYT